MTNDIVFCAEYDKKLKKNSLLLKSVKHNDNKMNKSMQYKIRIPEGERFGCITNFIIDFTMEFKEPLELGIDFSILVGLCDSGMVTLARNNLSNDKSCYDFESPWEYFDEGFLHSGSEYERIKYSMKFLKPYLKEGIRKYGEEKNINVEKNLQYLDGKEHPITLKDTDDKIIKTFENYVECHNYLEMDDEGAVIKLLTHEAFSLPKLGPGKYRLY